MYLSLYNVTLHIN